MTCCGYNSGNNYGLDYYRNGGGYGYGLNFGYGSGYGSIHDGWRQGYGMGTPCAGGVFGSCGPYFTPTNYYRQGALSTPYYW